MFEDMGYSRSYILELYSVCRGHVHHFSSNALFEDSYGEPNYRDAIRSTWYDDTTTDCSDGDLCSQISIPVGCPSGHFFRVPHGHTCPPHSLSDCSPSNGDEPGTCVPFVFSGYESLLFIFFLPFVVIGLLYYCLSPLVCARRTRGFLRHHKPDVLVQINNSSYSGDSTHSNSCSRSNNSSSSSSNRMEDMACRSLDFSDNTIDHTSSTMVQRFKKY